MGSQLMAELQILTLVLIGTRLKQETNLVFEKTKGIQHESENSSLQLYPRCLAIR